MGVIWGVAPFNAELRDRVKALGVTVDHPIEGNRLPTVAEVRAALDASDELRWEGSEGPTDGSWDASVAHGEDSTILNLTGVADASDAPKDLWLEKGSEELIAEILELLVPACGVLFVNNDADHDFFFIVGPGIDPYQYIDRELDEEPEAPAPVKAVPAPKPRKAAASGGRFLTCPSCSKPCHPKATRCRWCSAELCSAEDPGVSPSTLQEVDEIREWNPGPAKVPALFSPWTWILAVLVLAALAVDVTNQSVPLRWMGARFLNIVLVPLLFWSGVHRDLSVWRSRRLESPGDAVEYYFNRIARRLYRQGRRALADHPSAAKRHATLKAQIRQSGDLQVHRANILKVEILGKDLAVVEADLRMRLVTYVVIPIPVIGQMSRTVDEASRRSVKLVVRRHGRWSLVNGLLIDRIDRNLILCLRGKDA